VVVVARSPFELLLSEQAPSTSASTTVTTTERTGDLDTRRVIRARR